MTEKTKKLSSELIRSGQSLIDAAARCGMSFSTFAWIYDPKMEEWVILITPAGTKLNVTRKDHHKIRSIIKKAGLRPVFNDINMYVGNHNAYKFKESDYEVYEYQ